jgi:two-component system sensor histidine kinase KdpD
MNQNLRRKTPEELLNEMGFEEEAKGHLKIFLGYASGVGKSLRMLDEARRRQERGQDVVVGAVQPKISTDIQNSLNALEVIPLKVFPSGKAMDIEHILKRHPALCVVDGLAFDNPPGLANQTRWQDVRALVDAGITVLGSINIQYIEELQQQVEAITGKHVTETVPMSFIKSADEIEIVDAPPEEPMERSQEEMIKLEDRQKRLSTLRELALVLAADVVDFQLNEYLEKHGIKQNFGAQERILVCITPRANAVEMIETAQVVTERFHGEMTVAYVKQKDLSEADRRALEENFALASSAKVPIVILEGKNPADAILDFANSHAITQLFIGHTQRTQKWFWRDPVEKLIRRSRGMDLRIFPQ